MLSPKEHSESTSNTRSEERTPLDTQHLNYAKPMLDAIAMQEIEISTHCVVAILQIIFEYRSENVASRCLRMWW
jgi:hypothetical protein